MSLQDDIEKSIAESIANVAVEIVKRLDGATVPVDLSVSATVTIKGTIGALELAQEKGKNV